MNIIVPFLVAAAVFFSETSVAADASAPSSTPSESATDEKSAAARRLEQRALERWEALRTLDMEKLYTYTTPAYQQAFDVTHLSMQYAGQVQRLPAKLYSLRFTNDDATAAEVILEFRYRSATVLPGRVIEDIAWSKQEWVQIDGEWRIIERK